VFTARYGLYISLYSINWLIFITETECVYCAVQTVSLNIMQVSPSNALNDGHRSLVVPYLGKFAVCRQTLSPVNEASQEEDSLAMLSSADACAVWCSGLGFLFWPCCCSFCLVIYLLYGLLWLQSPVHVEFLHSLFSQSLEYMYLMLRLQFWHSSEFCVLWKVSSSEEGRWGLLIQQRMCAYVTV
jgi:hypothetical protein